MNKKLLQRDVSVNIVNRNRITTIIDKALDRSKILYLFAPVSWGKTTALMSYINTCKYRAKYFDTKEIFTNVNDLFYSEDTPRVIIIDSFEKIKNKMFLNKLSKFIKNSSQYYKFIILGRNKPPACFSEFMISGEIEILTANDLSFTKDEINEFYLENNINLNPMQIQKLFNYTEGWPAAVAIALTFLKSKYYSEEYLINEIKNYFEYFIEENIWNKWDQKYKNFFMRIALFSELPNDLCIELCEKYEITNISEYLLINVENNYYKINSLLQSFLMNKVNIDIVNKCEIYNDIGLWFERNNYEVEAISSYFKANEISKIVNILELSFKNNIEVSKIGIIGECVSRIANEELCNSSPIICTIMAIFEIINFNFSKAQKWHRYLLRMAENVDLDNEKRKEILYMSSFIKFYMPNTKYKEIFLLFMHLFDEENKQNVLVRQSNLMAGLPSVIRGVRDYSKIGRHYELLRKKIDDKIHAKAVKPTILEVGYAELEYERNNLSRSLMIITEQLYKVEDTKINSMFILNIVLGRIMCASGDINKSYEIMYKLREEIVRNKASYLLKDYKSYLARLELLKGDIDEAEKLTGNYDKGKEGKITCLDFYYYLTRVRIYIAKEKYQMAIMLLQRLYDISLANSYFLNIIECCILQSISLYKISDKELAFEKMHEALKLAQQYSYIRVFADEGDSCYIILNEYAKIKSKDIKEQYLNDILGEIKKFSGLYPKYMMGNLEVNNSKLTNAELRVIQLLDKGMSNLEISTYLNIKIDTVKFHTKNIYAKLGVKSRLQAVQKAKINNILE